MSHDPTALVLHAIKEVSQERLVKAVLGLADGSLTITLTRQTDNEIRALVKNGDGTEYGVTLTETVTTCSCKDSMYRGVVCKHQVAVALHVLRTPHAEAPAPQEPLPTPASRLVHLTSAVTPSGPRLCGSKDYSLPAWVIPFTPEEPWKDRTCLTCWNLYKQPATARLAA